MISQERTFPALALMTSSFDRCDILTDTLSVRPLSPLAYVQHPKYDRIKVIGFGGDSTQAPTRSTHNSYRTRCSVTGTQAQARGGALSLLRLGQLHSCS